jgi:alpha-mannosidase
LQRLRVALMPCAQGWRQQAVPLQAQRFREPLWIRPAAGGAVPQSWPALDLGSTALQLVQLQPLEQPGMARLTLQNLSPQRVQLRWPAGWCGQREPREASAADLHADDLLLPWHLGHWQIWCAGGEAQSS